MKKLILLFFIALNLDLYSQDTPCKECSRSGLAGFDYYQSSSGYNLGSAVGGIAYRAVESNDGNYKLLSGYMPICVMPYASIGSGDTVCSNSNATFTAAGYLTDSYTWIVNGSDINLNSDTYIPLRQNTKSKDGYKEKIVFKASKGKYSAESDTAYYKENPMPWVDVSTVPASLCIGQQSAFEIKEQVFGKVHSIYWTKSTGLTFPDNNNKAIANISLTDDAEYEAQITTDNGCDTTIAFKVTVNKPSCEVDIVSPLPLNPADVTIESPITIPIRIKKVSGFTGCIPDSATAYLQIRASMFFPNTSSDKAKITYQYSGYKQNNLIEVKGKVRESLANGDYILELEGWPLLGDVESTPIQFDSLSWDSKTYPASMIQTKVAANGYLEILCCGNKTTKRLIEKAGGVAITKVSPMPIFNNKITVDIESIIDEPHDIVIDLFNSLGEKLESYSIPRIGLGLNKIEVTLSNIVQSGIYQLVVSGSNITYPIILTK